jgi:hypothetical protein
MELSSLSEPGSEPPTYRWATLIGTTIALLTITFPFYAISNYSSVNKADLLPPRSYISQPRF